MLNGVGRTIILLALLLTTMTFQHVAAQVGVGTIDGTVLDAAQGEPLPGAKISVEGTVLTAAADRDGRFRLTVPAGRHVLTVSYLGWQEQRLEVEVATDRTLSQEIRLLGDEHVVQETVTVTAEAIRDAQARALNQQRTAPNITNIVSADQIGQFPDTNAVEAVQRIPGVSIQRDQGEGRYIIVRGTEPRLNSLMINGERVPSPDAELRQVAADVIPADVLQTIEVSKALTPDMDADAIGGAINLVMKQAPGARALRAGRVPGGSRGNRAVQPARQNGLRRLHGPDRRGHTLRRLPPRRRAGEPARASHRRCAAGRGRLHRRHRDLVASARTRSPVRHLRGDEQHTPELPGLSLAGVAAAVTPALKMSGSSRDTN